MKCKVYIANPEGWLNIEGGDQMKTKKAMPLRSQRKGSSYAKKHSYGTKRHLSRHARRNVRRGR